MGSLLLKLLVGAIAGTITWFVAESVLAAQGIQIYSTAWDAWEQYTTLFLGGMIGAAVGGLDGYTRGGKVHTLRGLLGGAVLGAIGCSFGHTVGSTLATGIFGPGVFTTDLGIIGLGLRIIARTIAFIPIGVFLGAAIGASSLNVRKIIQGATGGGIGGAVAGLVFDVVGQLLAAPQLAGQRHAEVGGPGRALLFILLGGLIGLFIGLVERLTRSAWVRLVLGRNEGKEWAIDAPQVFLGRSESCAIPLFGDPNVAPVHASITKQSGQYILADGGSPVGTYLNGQRIGQAVLFHGAQIQIAGLQLLFLMRNQAVPQRVPDGRMMVQPAPMTPQPMQPAPSNPTVAYANPVGTVLALVVLDGPLAGQRVAVTAQIELGRESAALPMSYDSNASRRHAAIAPAVGALVVTDLGSTNGTFVNGQRVQQSPAGPGSLIKIGNTSFRVEPA